MLLTYLCTAGRECLADWMQCRWICLHLYVALLNDCGTAGTDLRHIRHSRPCIRWHTHSDRLHWRRMPCDCCRSRSHHSYLAMRTDGRYCRTHLSHLRLHIHSKWKSHYSNNSFAVSFKSHVPGYLHLFDRKQRYVEVVWFPQLSVLLCITIAWVMVDFSVEWKIDISGMLVVIVNLPNVLYG